MNIWEFIPFLSFLLLSGILTGRIFSLKKRGIQTSSKQKGKKKLSPFLLLLFGAVFLLWLFEIIQPAFKFTVLPEILTQKIVESIYFQFSGTVLIILSLVILTITLIHFNTSIRFGLDKNNKGKLITNGIFSFSRNPFFLSLELYFLGVALVLPNVFLLVFTLAAFTGIHFFILKEEKFLHKNYGEEYRAYRQKTRRYL